MGTLGRLAFIIGLAATAGAAGCFLSQADEEVGGTDDEVNAGGDVSNILKSTLMLDTGCMATKVGPRHLLTSARCVVGKSEYESGKTIKFKVAATSVNNIIAAPPEDDEEEAPRDAGAKDAGPKDGGSSTSTRPPNTSMREATIAEVNVHASYTAKCKEEACAFTAIGASDAKDIAVIVLDADLETVPTVPIDLGTVGQADPVIALASGCSKFDGTPTKLKSIKTIAVPAKSVNHTGSAYTAEPQLVTRLNGGYIVSPGIGWRDDEPNICKNDIGAPMFRGDTAAVVGVTSNFTVFDKTKLIPVTIHSTRTDATSKVGMWLKEMGVETVDTCGEEGCAKREYDGGVPTQTTGATTPSGDGGALTDGGGTSTSKKDSGKDEEEDEDKDPPSTDLPDQGEESTLPPSAEDQYQPKEPNSGEGYDAGAKKKKKKAAEGCSFAPASTTSAPLGGFGLIGMGIGVAAVIRRRRSR